MFEFSPENISKLWEAASKFPILFGKELTSPQDFIDQFIKYDKAGNPDSTGLVFIVDDFVGAFYLTDIYDDQVEAHYSYFDRRFRGRVELGKMMLKWVFTTFGFARINAKIPVHVGTAPFEYARKLGFVPEGRLREAASWKGERFDVVPLGILRHEVMNGNEN
jgi:RimJ/RimL family protein N-acetyltransferase